MAVATTLGPRSPSTRMATSVKRSASSSSKPAHTSRVGLVSGMQTSTVGLPGADELASSSLAPGRGSRAPELVEQPKPPTSSGAASRRALRFTRMLLLIGGEAGRLVTRPQGARVLDAAHIRTAHILA